MYSTTEIKISKTALLHFIMLTFVLELLKKKKCYEIYFADKGSGCWLHGGVSESCFYFVSAQTQAQATLSNTKAVLTVKLHAVFLCNIKKKSSMRNEV